MMMFNGPQTTTTYTPGRPATAEGPPAPHSSPIDLDPHQFNLPPPCTEVSSQPQPQPQSQPQSQPRIQTRLRRKRKADPQDTHNERLSKRMSLLNLEQNGQKLYIPVEQPQIPSSAFASITTVSNNAPAPTPTPSAAAALAAVPEAAEEPMQLDDTKHKVYIYNLDDELSSDNESDTEGKLVFLPDIEKHLRKHRLNPHTYPLAIPKPILPNKDGELAGMQLVLYSDGPSSISVPEEQDSVRKAIIEARTRLREKQQKQSGTGIHKSHEAKPTKISFATPVRFEGATRQLREDRADASSSSSSSNSGSGSGSGSTSALGSGMASDTEMMTDDDADAMDID